MRGHDHAATLFNSSAPQSMLKKWVTQRRKDAKVRECHEGIFAALRFCVSLIRDFFNMLLHLHEILLHAEILDDELLPLWRVFAHEE